MSAMKHWMRELHEHLPGGLVPMQWVPAYVGVTRPAVKQRADAGMLTVFTFKVGEYRSKKGKKREVELVELPKTLLGESRQHFDYVPLAECEAWRMLVAEKRTP